MRKALAIAGASLALLFLAVPTPTYAANATFFGPIVPAECHCDNQIGPDGKPINTAPDYGCVLQTIENAINFAVSFSIILFIIYLTFAGFRLVTSGGSSEARSQAKTRLLNVIVGLAVLLTSWLLVDWVMKTIYNDGSFGPWNAILSNDSGDVGRCIVAKNPASLASGTVGLNLSSSTESAGGVIGAGTGASQMNIPAAAAYASSHAQSSPGGQCAYYVRLALAAGGLTQFNSNHPASAYQYGPYLTGAGFNQVKTGTYSPSLEGNIQGLQAGDVVVFQPVSGHKDGHIAIYTGSQWISDYKQSTMSSNPSDYNGGSYTIYRP